MSGHCLSTCQMNLSMSILETIELLFRPVNLCNDSVPPPQEFETCQEYWNATKEAMQDRSFEVAGFWAIVAFGCIVGNIVTFWGFGHASERMSKRVRDSAFSSLVRQEVAFFDKRSVGKITSELQDDAARIQSFTGEPIRSFLIAMASVFTGVVLSFVVSAKYLYVIVRVVGVSLRLALDSLVCLLVHVAVCPSCSGMYSDDGLCNKS
jgi:ABC-type multidrug transport system fused ATPase/permease subunit